MSDTPRTDKEFASYFGGEFQDYTPNQKLALEYARNQERDLVIAQRERDSERGIKEAEKKILLVEIEKNLLVTNLVGELVKCLTVPRPTSEYIQEVLTRAQAFIEQRNVE